ncbi:Hypothetical predicted protein [Podarcis lilfordi]|uniref:Uncharacterized protein n=1 Tax=Podarcis lilfordi TaxID=74358 RepID=A0AA35QPP3_9SAUR|nr:Hypothetical predicted protein [Podarcis lilfordi]
MRGTDKGWYMSISEHNAASACEHHACYSMAKTGLNRSFTLELSHGSHVVPRWRSPASSSGAWCPLLAYTGRVLGAFQVIFSSLASVALDNVQFRNCGPQTEA